MSTLLEALTNGLKKQIVHLGAVELIFPQNGHWTGSAASIVSGSCDCWKNTKNAAQ